MERDFLAADLLEEGEAERLNRTREYMIELERRIMEYVSEGEGK